MNIPDPGLIYDLTTGVFRSPVVRLALQLDWFLQNTSLDTIHMLHPNELRINLLGPPQLTWRGDPFDATRRQVRGLLFYLAHVAAPAPRQRRAGRRNRVRPAGAGANGWRTPRRPRPTVR